MSALNDGVAGLYTNSTVIEVITNNEDVATGVSYISKENSQETTMKARTIVLAVSACRTARILVNSKSAQHENSLDNNSCHAGRYLH